MEQALKYNDSVIASMQAHVEAVSKETPQAESATNK